MFIIFLAGLNGEVEMNCNGDRVNAYSLLSFNRNARKFEVGLELENPFRQITHVLDRL